jgi:hypothetical protein
MSEQAGTNSTLHANLSKILQQHGSTSSHVSKKTTSTMGEQARTNSKSQEILAQVDGKIDKVLKNLADLSKIRQGSPETDGQLHSQERDCHTLDSNTDLVLAERELSKSIAKLSKLVTRKQGLFDSEEMYNVIESLSTLINAPVKLLDVGYSRPLQHHGEHMPSPKMRESVNLQKIGGMLLSSPTICINKPGKSLQLIMYHCLHDS